METTRNNNFLETKSNNDNKNDIQKNDKIKISKLNINTQFEFTEDNKSYENEDGSPINLTDNNDYSGTVINKYSRRSHFDLPVCTCIPEVFLCIFRGIGSNYNKLCLAFLYCFFYHVFTAHQSTGLLSKSNV